MKRLSAAAILTMLPMTPAWAGAASVPGPEAGVGLGALAALGVGYAWMRHRANR